MEHTRIFPAAATPLVGGHVIFLTNYLTMLMAIGANLICDMIVAKVGSTAIANVEDFDVHFLSLSFSWILSISALYRPIFTLQAKSFLAFS